MLPTDSLSAFALAAVIALLITYLLMRRRPSKARARSTRNDALDTVADWPPEAARVMTTPERKAYETVRRALPQQVDKALEKFGFAMGPFRVGDLAGLDIGWAGRKRRAAENPSAYQRVVADAICEQGRFGQKTGAGWYRYEAGAREPIPDPLVADIIEQFRKDRGIDTRKISDDEVIERCVFALVNEGARILDEKIAARASDIDVVYLNGYGFPQHRGGPMLYADIVGLPNVVRSLRRFAAEAGAEAWWQPAPLLVKLADDGKTFN